MMETRAMKRMKTLRMEDPYLNMDAETLTIVRSAYDLKGRDTTLDDRQVLPPILTDSRLLQETLCVTDPRSGLLTLGVPPLSLVEDIMHEEVEWDATKSESLADLFNNTRPGNRDMLNVGYSSLSVAGVGPFLQRVNPNEARGGIRLPTEESCVKRGSQGRILLQELNEGLQSILETCVASPVDKDSQEDWPTAADVRKAIVEASQHCGAAVPEEPFPGCLHQNVSLGRGNMAGGLTLFHVDQFNAGLLAKKSADPHFNLTHNPSKGFVVNVLTKEGNIQPYVIVQCRHATTFFRAANCKHGTVDIETFLFVMTQELGIAYKTAGNARTSNVKASENHKEEDEQRVFAAFYSRHAMLDLAWEFRSWVASRQAPFFRVAGMRARQRPHISNRALNRVEAMYGLVSPYNNEYNRQHDN